MEVYKCFKCLLEKPIDQFFKDKNRNRGFRETCKECCSLIRAPYFKNRNYPIANIKNKVCTFCKIDKPISEFNRNKCDSTGLTSHCKLCRKEKSKIHYLKTSEKKKIQTKIYYQNNKEKCRNTKARRNKIRLKTNPLYALRRRLSNRLYYALQKKNWKKTTKFFDYIGCTLDYLKNHIEKQFLPGMTWKNKGEWHIDHYIPLSSAKTEEEMLVLCNYKNLRPMWAKDNIKKGHKIPTIEQSISF